MTTDVLVWLDPSCPWAWQTMRWLRGLRDNGVLHLRYDTFSLEVNGWDRELPYREAAPTYGEALVASRLALREGGDTAFEALTVALGERLHDERVEMSRDELERAARAAGLDDGFVARATGPLFDELADEVIAAWRAAREHDVFGVPTLQIDDDKVIYGPILATAPVGEDATALWSQVKGLADRGTFFELKRWPRDVRPGEVEG
jgi:predicted DsbA family dithiol-disulfide isomerase